MSRPDLAVLAAEAPVPAAAVFGPDPSPAAPVAVSRQHIAAAGGFAQCVVLNGGSANAVTGPEGVTIAMLMAAEAASGLGCAAEHILVASTGAVGVPPPLDRVTAGIRLALGTMSASGGSPAATVIASPDCPGHYHALTVETPRGAFVVGGMATCSCVRQAAGAGTFTVLTTDAWMAPAVLQHALERSSRDASNDTRFEASISDSLMALASGASGVPVDDEDSYFALVEGLIAVSRELAAPIVCDSSLNTL